MTELQWVKRHLDEVAFGTIRLSSAAVPHITGEVNGITFSVCYFNKSRSYRVFYPYPASRQYRVDFKTSEEVNAFLGRLI